MTAKNFVVKNGLDTPVLNVTTTAALPSGTTIGSVTSAELGHLAGVTSGIQSQLGARQPLDADLTAIAALAGTSGLLKKTAANTWTLDTSAYLTANQTITLSGDASGSGTTSISVTVADDSHNHTGTTISGLDASDTTTGTFNIARIPTGTSGTTVSLGDHTHSYLSSLTNSTQEGYFGKVHLDDTTSTYYLALVLGTASNTLTANRTFTINTKNANRELVLDGFTQLTLNATASPTVNFGSGGTVSYSGHGHSVVGEVTAISANAITQDTLPVARGGTGVTTKTGTGSVVLNNTPTIDTIEASASGATTYLWPALTSGSAHIGNGLTTGNLYLGNNLTSGDVYIASAGLGAKLVKIGGTGTATVDVTGAISVTGTISATGTITAPTFSGNLSGNATTATSATSATNATNATNATTATSAGKWTTARTLTLGGDLTGNVSIDGSANVTLTAAVTDNSHTHQTNDVYAVRLRHAGSTGGTAMVFNWSDIGGTPSYLWGGSDINNMYVYPPSRLSVAYAATAGSAAPTAHSHSGSTVLSSGLTPNYWGQAVMTDGDYAASGACFVSIGSGYVMFLTHSGSIPGSSVRLDVVT